MDVHTDFAFTQNMAYYIKCFNCIVVYFGVCSPPNPNPSLLEGNLNVKCMYYVAVLKSLIIE